MAHTGPYPVALDYTQDTCTCCISVDLEGESGRFATVRVIDDDAVAAGDAKQRHHLERACRNPLDLGAAQRAAASREVYRDRETELEAAAVYGDYLVLILRRRSCWLTLVHRPGSK